MARIPLGPAHYPSAPGEGAFSSQQLSSAQLLLINFPQHFPRAQEPPADGPTQSSKDGGLGKQPRRGAEKGLNLESKILGKTEAHTVQAHLGHQASFAEGHRAVGATNREGNMILPARRSEQMRLWKGSAFAENFPSSSRLKDVSAHTYTHLPFTKKIWFFQNSLRWLIQAEPRSALPGKETKESRAQTAATFIHSTNTPRVPAMCSDCPGCCP